MTSLDSEDLKNYRPVSNFSFMSKVLEKVVLVMNFGKIPVKVESILDQGYQNRIC